MNKQKENNNALIKGVMMIGLFLFIIVLFNSTDCTHQNSFNNNFAVVHVLEVDNSAILVSPITFPNFNNPFSTWEIVTFTACNKNFRNICLTNKVNQLLKNCREQFIVIKPRIINPDSFHIRTSLNYEEVSPIS